MKHGNHGPETTSWMILWAMSDRKLWQTNDWQNTGIDRKYTDKTLWLTVIGWQETVTDEWLTEHWDWQEIDWQNTGTDCDWLTGNCDWWMTDRLLWLILHIKIWEMMQTTLTYNDWWEEYKSVQNFTEVSIDYNVTRLLKSTCTDKSIKQFQRWISPSYI